ncbi:MAG: hypothetical protein HY782_15390 [Chloroflexi bacterium]|nr:hypothetical protein [Chloroflexota bacterium]
MNKIYVDGNFTLAGSADANYIARWDGSNWSALGSGLNGYATAITTGGGSVYAAGNFTTAGAKASYHFARWYEFIPTTIIYFPIIAK